MAVAPEDTVSERSPVLAGSPTMNGEVKLFSFLQELSEPIKNVAVIAYRARGKLANDMQAYVYLMTSAAASMPTRAVAVVNDKKLAVFLSESEDPEALAAVGVGTGTMLSLGCVGGLAGTAVGATTGTVAGALPALFTFGLSLPIGAAVGGSTGLLIGAVAGGAAGFAGGAITGYGFALYRAEIQRCTVNITSRVQKGYMTFILQPGQKVRRGALAIGDKARETHQYSKENWHLHVATAGAVSGGTAGAAGGALTGGTLGALIGLVPALFTFGLSIPVFAVVGGGTGLVAGGAAGTVGGGAAGHLGYKYRHMPGATVGFAKERAAKVTGVVMGSSAKGEAIAA